MSGNEWVKVWSDGVEPTNYDQLGANREHAGFDGVAGVPVRITLQEEGQASLPSYNANTEDVSVLLAFCAFLGSNDKVFQVREADVEQIRVDRSSYGSPLEIILTIWGIGGAVVGGAAALAKILKTVAEAFKTHQEGIGQMRRNRREREVDDERIVADAFRQSMDELGPKDRAQLDKVLSRMEGRGREVRLARSLANLTAKAIEVRVNDPEDRD